MTVFSRAERLAQATRPTSVVLAAPSPRRPSRASCRSASGASSGRSARGTDARRTGRTRRTSASRARAARSANRKRVSRSPYQRKKPVIAKSSANAAVMIAFSFWPAFSRPCGGRGRGARRGRRRRTGRSPAPSRRKLPAVAEERRSARARRPGDGRVEVDRLEQRPPADRLGEARQIEAEPGPSRIRNAVACTQCTARPCARSAEGARPRLIAIRPPHPGVLVVAVLLQKPVGCCRDELDPREPLHALVAVHLGITTRAGAPCGRDSGLPSRS